MEDASLSRARRLMPLAALVIAVLFLIHSYGPLLAPLSDDSLVFSNGDFATLAGSASIRGDQSFYLLLGGGGNIEASRFFLLRSFGRLADFVPFSDSQFHSAMILISMLIGSLGVFWLIRQQITDGPVAAALTLIMIPFYFLNPWSLERIVHIWIWFTYAILPMQLALGLEYMKNKNIRHLGAYSLLFSMFGPLPHSFIYMLGVHAATAVHAIMRQEKRTLLMFAIIPLVLYAVTNMPILGILVEYMSHSGFDYPSDVGDTMLSALSRSGGLVNLMTFSNNWWPRIEKPDIQENLLFSSTSLAIFIAVFSIFALAYDRMGRDEKVMGLVFLGAILISMFIAQGLNNSILEYIVDSISDAGLRELIGPFREWARVSILIPVFMIALLSFSLQGSERQRAAVIVLGAIVFINLATGPSQDYLEGYMPLHVGDAYDKLAELVPQEARIVWIGDDKIPATALDGTFRMIKRKVGIDIGSPTSAKPYEDMFLTGRLDFSIVKSHHISYFVLDGNVETPYRWLDCEKVDYFKLCSTGVGSRRFSAYEDIAAAEGAGGESERVIWQTQMDLTRWKVKVDADDNFMLVFVERYLPGWEARIFKDGELLSTAGSVEVAKSINGFWIEETGELEILLVYAPQEGYEMLLLVSAAGMLASLTMMAIGGRRYA